ncbi:glycosyltransferase family 2 protein [Pseudorhodobacter ferrugineus]|uniref:glycosyltransferase family 2 protein n=1 Tax=Pseudorhodobacter ferrugineus TaxID=77008 RepID=UPI0003B5AA7F|nr:glycosyltransferase family 2 protein [Pseudorhodobacter ferrugineus]
MGGYTVITTMKNEAAFLLEWVAHYKALGFDHLVICTNDCADVTVEMVLRLQDLGLARHHPTRHWPVTSIQRSALKQARRYVEVTEAEWIYVCDADEFLVVKVGDGSARALVAAASTEAEVISVAWRVFGPDGRREYVDAPVTGQFCRAGAEDLRQGIYAKSLFRGLENMQRIGIHGPIPRAELGRPLRREMPGGIGISPQVNAMLAARDYRVAQVNHYALRSLDSFLVKRDRGRVNHTGQTMEAEYWDRFDVADVECDAIRRYDDAVAAWRAQLQADAALDGLHMQALAWHLTKIAELRGQADYAPLLAALEERISKCAPPRS